MSLDFIRGALKGLPGMTTMELWYIKICSMDVCGMMEFLVCY